MINYTVNHLDQSGNIIGTFIPENLDFSVNYKAPHDISYEVSKANPGMYWDFVGPYRTDWELLLNGVRLIAGIHTGVSQNDIEDDFVTVTGKDWSHYLERRVYPYAPQFGKVGLYVQDGVTDVSEIVRRILVDTRDIDSYSLDYTLSLQFVGFAPLDYEISYGESSSIYQHVLDLSNMNWSEGGFDFEMTKTKIFKLYAPSYASPDSPVYLFDGTLDLANFQSLSFANKGPRATHVRGQGAGTVVTQAALRDFPNNSAVYRRLDLNEDVGDFRDLNIVGPLTSRVLSASAYPQHELSFSIDPNNIIYSNFWSTFWPGTYVQFINFDLKFHRLQGGENYRINQIRTTWNTEGESLAEFTVEPWHHVSSGAGLVNP